MKFKKWLLVFLLLISCSIIQKAYAAEPSSNPTTLFHEAAISYKSGDYKKAIDLYESIFKSGQVSGPLYFNLGNSYFKTGELGKAIVNYERAKQLMPRDPDLLANLKFALSNVKNEEGVKRSFLRKMLTDYADSLTVDELTWLLFLFFFLTGILYYLGLLLKWPATRYVASIVLSCVLLFFHGGIFYYKLSHQKNAAIVLRDTAAKFEPVDNATTYFDLPQGGRIKIIKEEQPWFKIKRPDGKLGWIKAETAEKI